MLGSVAGRPLAVACAVACLYAGWTGWYTTHHAVESLAHVGRMFEHRAGESPAISHLPSDRDAPTGYDGQFFLYIALDPLHARSYLDAPAYRYSRPVYPLAARVLAAGRSRAIPWTLLLLGIAGVVTATFATATLLERQHVSPWWAALLGIYPGLVISVSWDLAEALAYGLTALGVLAFRRDRRLVAAGLFGIAGVTRETTLLFPLALSLWLAWRARRPREALQLLVVSAAPYMAVKIALVLWLHSGGAVSATRFEPVPFLGLIRQWPWTGVDGLQTISVVVPALGALAVAWRAYRVLTPEVMVLAVNVLVLVLLLPQPSYDDYLASGRITTGVILAFMLCLPRVVAERRYLEASPLFILWLAPLYAVLSAAHP